MSKSLLLVVTYVSETALVEADYAKRLEMRSLLRHEFTTDHSHSRCVVFGGAEHPPWVAVVSGAGPESVADHVLSEHAVGPRHLVFFTDEIDADIAWMRQRGYGFERVITLDGTQVLRRVTATMPELGQIVDLVERPSGDADASVWLRPIAEAINAPLRTDALAVRGAGVSRPREREHALLPALALPRNETGARWLERIAQCAWSSSCSTVRDGRIDSRFAALVRHIAERGIDVWFAERRAARERMLTSGVGSADFATSGGPIALVDSPLFVNAEDARRMLAVSAQRAVALRGLLGDAYSHRPTSITDREWSSNPFAYVQKDWAPPQPSGLVQMATDFVRDTEGRYTPIEDNTDSGRSGLATLAPVREYFEDWYAGLPARLGAWSIGTPGRALLDHVTEEFAARPEPLAVMAYRREPPPYDQPDWEDVLLARQMGIALVAESLLQLDASGLCLVRDGRRRPIDILFHRRSSTHYQFQDWMRLVRAGKLRIIDPVSSALCNDRAVRVHIDELVHRYTNELPVIGSPETLSVADGIAFARVSASPHAWVYKERGGSSGRRVVCGSDVLPDVMPAFLRSISDVSERWIAQRELEVASSLFIEPDGDGVRVWEGRASVHSYTTVGATVRPMQLLTARVSPSLTHRVPGPLGLLAADVWICDEPRR